MLFKKLHPPVGARPGTLVISNEAMPPVIRVMAYTADRLEELTPSSVEELPAIIERNRATWVDVQGLGDEALLRRIGELFELHALALEDAVNVPQRPKSEIYEHHYLYITRMTMLRSSTDTLIPSRSASSSARTTC